MEGTATSIRRCDFEHWFWDGSTYRHLFSGRSHDETCRCGRRWDQEVRL
jgi:hypothetical protein